MNKSFALHCMSKQIIILTIISAALAGIFYYFRTTFLDLNPVQDNLFRAIRMTCVFVILPFGWALWFKKESLSEMGFTKKKLLPSIFFGLAVYSIALVAFYLSLGNPDFDQYFRWGSEYSINDWLLIMALVSWMAFVTDLWTRGFILMLLAKYQSSWFGILVQNIIWVSIHLYEVAILGPSMSIIGALCLTIVLGVLGDVVALRTKNIIGLGIGHIYLNLVFFSYIRFFL